MISRIRSHLGICGLVVWLVSNPAHAQTRPNTPARGPEAAAAASPAAPAPLQNANNSRWVLLPNIHLEDVLYPVASEGNATPKATVLGTSHAALKSGESVLVTLTRLDNPEPRSTQIRPVDYVRCYEYFTANFSQNGTRCFVLQPNPRTP